jgi:hypothetical protein
LGFKSAGNFVLQSGPCSFLYLHIGPWGIPSIFLLPLTYLLPWCLLPFFFPPAARQLYPIPILLPPSLLQPGKAAWGLALGEHGPKRRSTRGQPERRAAPRRGHATQQARSRARGSWQCGVRKPERQRAGAEGPGRHGRSARKQRAQAALAPEKGAAKGGRPREQAAAARQVLGGPRQAQAQGAAGPKQMSCRRTERLQQAAGVRASGRQRQSARGASRCARGRSAGVAQVATA